MARGRRARLAPQAAAGLVHGAVRPAELVRAPVVAQRATPLTVRHRISFHVLATSEVGVHGG